MCVDVTLESIRTCLCKPRSNSKCNLFFSYFQSESSDKIYQERKEAAKQSLEKRFLEKQEQIRLRETEKNTRQPLENKIVDNKEKINLKELDEQNPKLSYYDNRPISIYPIELRAGNHSEDYHRSAFISKKKKVLDNPTSSDLAVYRVSSEPCLQKKRITMYPKNHNILRTFTVKEEASILFCYEFNSSLYYDLF